MVLENVINQSAVFLPSFFPKLGDMKRKYEIFVPGTSKI
jgi:hypothetical protein